MAMDQYEEKEKRNKSTPEKEDEEEHENQFTPDSYHSASLNDDQYDDSSRGSSTGNGSEEEEEKWKARREQKVVRPSSHLPQPEAPPGLLAKSKFSGGEDYHPVDRSLSANSDVSFFAKYFRDSKKALAKRISSMKEPDKTLLDDTVTEFHLSGLKVIVKMKDDNEVSPAMDLEFKGRISFFSRSNCRDCGAVRSFFREKGLRYVEINVDVFPSREKELVQRTGSSSVPQVFFNEKLLGGLVALNSLRNSGEFEKRLREMVGPKCQETAPRVPVYGFEEEEEEEEGKEGKEKADGMVAIVRVLRQRIPIQDRITKMKLVKNCFAGNDLVEAVINHLDCGRKKAVEIGKELARKHFIHHVFRENDFEDGNHFYRFFEHDPIIPKCFNCRGSTNDYEPQSASVLGQRLTKLMFAILEAYASDDRRHLDYNRISVSEEFRRYVNLVQDLQRVDVFKLSADEKMAFFLNLYNAMVIHAVIRVGRPEGVIDRRSFFSDFHYIIGGYPYSLSTIKNGILRSNQRQPYTFVKPFGAGDKRLELSLPKVNPLIHFGLCNATRSSPTVRFFSTQGIEVELRSAAREFFQGGGMQVDLEKRTVYLTRIIKWYSSDFGQEKAIPKWILNFLDATKAGLLTHLLSDGSPINIVYQNFDWSLNI